MYQFREFALYVLLASILGLAGSGIYWSSADSNSKVASFFMQSMLAEESDKEFRLAEERRTGVASIGNFVETQDLHAARAKRGSVGLIGMSIFGLLTLISGAAFLAIPAKSQVGARQQELSSGEHADFTEHLQRLVVLRDAGKLTDEEFRAAKSKLLT